ncbi:MAG TPA: hypothetical protein VN805_14870 [Caulobacteraceae bacterium]|nr:hypothetical protein [Caulobacteraceae bacterium]
MRLADVWYDASAWVQAIGTIAAVVGAAWVAAGESRAARLREEADRQAAAEREAKALAASRTAAMNLAILAVTQIHDLHALLKDEARRSRVQRVSPSRTLETNERLLTAFPIQSLNDADAMVAFAFFPGALATAAESTPTSRPRCGPVTPTRRRVTRCSPNSRDRWASSTAPRSAGAGNCVNRSSWMGRHQAPKRPQLKV